MILYIVRHGKPDYATDTLLDEGWKQAEAVGRRLCKKGLDRIFASPMGRAQQTAMPAARLTGLEITTEDWAHEIGDERMTTYPDGERRSVSLIQNTYLLENGAYRLDYEHGFNAPGMRETQMDRAAAFLRENGDLFLEKLGYKYEGGIFRIVRPNDERVALFCHAAMARCWVAVLLHIPMHLMWAGTDYGFTGLTAIEFANNENGLTAPKCLYFGDVGHLEE